MAEPPLPNGSALQLLLTTSELTVGANRLAFGLLKEHTDRGGRRCRPYLCS
jgi:hypothetical protein